MRKRSRRRVLRGHKRSPAFAMKFRQYQSSKLSVEPWETQTESKLLDKMTPAFMQLDLGILGIPIEPRHVTELRGVFRLSFKERIMRASPMIAMMVMGIGLSVWGLFVLHMYSTHWVFMLVIFSVFEGIPLWGLYVLTTSFEFDGKTITCRRLAPLVKRHPRLRPWAHFGPP